jgi:GNAT superfamily N-acetyltransferase
VPVRRLWLSDLPAFKAHLHRLDHDTLHDRFGGYVSESFIDDYAETCLREGSVVYGYFDGDFIKGAGELHWTIGTVSAEAALSVDSDQRHRGIGTLLFARVIRAACNRGITTLSVICLPHNQAMLSLARKFDAALRFETDEITGLLISRRLTPLSLWTEYADDSLGFVDAVFDVQKQFLKHFLHMPSGFMPRFGAISKAG